ncbi:hypothetical protein R1flu_012691 [Riccia fluitans]|uniref:40S ribosomal protein S30 n=1 Tax=Riccia fluitans TaxID=41844 RepID=A0ABD1ZBC1_9MARC
MSKVHGSLARAGKVRGQTPKVQKQDKKKRPKGRAYKRIQYNRRFVTSASRFQLVISRKYLGAKKGIHRLPGVLRLPSRSLRFSPQISHIRFLKI